MEKVIRGLVIVSVVAAVLIGVFYAMQPADEVLRPVVFAAAIISMVFSSVVLFKG